MKPASAGLTATGVINVSASWNTLVSTAVVTILYLNLSDDTAAVC